MTVIEVVSGLMCNKVIKIFFEWPAVKSLISNDSFEDLQCTCYSVPADFSWKGLGLLVLSIWSIFCVCWLSVLALLIISGMSFDDTISTDLDGVHWSLLFKKKKLLCFCNVLIINLQNYSQRIDQFSSVQTTLLSHKGQLICSFPCCQGNIKTMRQRGAK